MSVFSACNGEQQDTIAVDEVTVVGDICVSMYTTGVTNFCTMPHDQNMVSQFCDTVGDVINVNEFEVINSDATIVSGLMDELYEGLVVTLTVGSAYSEPVTVDGLTFEFPSLDCQFKGQTLTITTELLNFVCEIEGQQGTFSQVLTGDLDVEVSCTQTVFPTTTEPITRNDPSGLVSSGDAYTCALRADDAHVECWGYNYYGQSTVSFDVPYSQVSSGSHHTCALRADNAHIECWGYNDNGQSTVSPDVPYSQVSSGGYHTCALRADNAHIECWGQNYYGQSTVSPDVPYSQVSSGAWHTCALRADDAHVECWGSNDYGQTTVTPDIEYGN